MPNSHNEMQIIVNVGAIVDMNSDRPAQWTLVRSRDSFPDSVGYLHRLLQHPFWTCLFAWPPFVCQSDLR